MKRGAGAVAYRPVRCAYTGKYGILALEGQGQTCALACPVAADEGAAEALARRLEREQTPVEAFEQAFLAGQL